MSEYGHEPIPGLPGQLPPGERILWQGGPDCRTFARTAFHTHTIAAYFAVLVAWAFAAALMNGVTEASDLLPTGATLALGVGVVALLEFLARAAARSTIYTLTDRRLVMRIGIAVPKCINLPLREVAAVDLGWQRGSTGDLAVTMRGAPKLGYLMLWPHARGWRFARPVPMLRALSEPAQIAALVARTCLAANPEGRLTPVSQPAADVPALGEAVAA